MIENVRNAMARMAAIQDTIAGRVGVTPLSASSVSRQTMQALLAEATRQLAQQSGTYGGYPYDLTAANALTPTVGAVRSGAPPGFEGYDNGRLPTSRLVPVPGTSEFLWGPAASALDHMRSQATKAGLDIGVISGYRTYDGQVRLADELGLYKNGGKAAVPGTSQHGWGRAVDLELGDEEVAWLRANAWKYGFVETVPREPWHWEFHPAG